MAAPTKGELYMKLIEHVRKAQEHSAMLGHLHAAEGTRVDQVLSHGWLGMSELFKKIGHQVTNLAQGKLQ